LRVKSAKRNIVYLSPGHGGFVAAFALGEKAAAEVRASGLPKHVIEAVENAPRYAEGRGVRLAVGPADCDAVVELARIKMRN
jgi:hypothetical protein